MFQQSAPNTISRRALLLMPLSLAGLIATYSRVRRPELPFVDKADAGEFVTIDLFDPDGRLSSSVRTHELSGKRS